MACSKTGRKVYLSCDPLIEWVIYSFLHSSDRVAWRALEQDFWLICVLPWEDKVWEVGRTWWHPNLLHLAYWEWQSFIVQSIRGLRSWVSGTLCIVFFCNMMTLIKWASHKVIHRQVILPKNNKHMTFWWVLPKGELTSTEQGTVQSWGIQWQVVAWTKNNLGIQQVLFSYRLPSTQILPPTTTKVSFAFSTLLSHLLPISIQQYNLSSMPVQGGWVVNCY